MSSTPLPIGLLDRAALAVGPGTAPAVAGELAALTGRPVLGYDAEGRITGAEGGAPDAPLVLVGATLPPALRGDPGSAGSTASTPGSTRCSTAAGPPGCC